MAILMPREPLQIVRGLASRVPRMRKKPKGGEAPSASYSYDVWMKHLWHLWKNGVTKVPETVVELGPGRSIGVGLAALLSGANTYYGLDSARICDLSASTQLLQEILVLFRERAGQQIKGWPAYGPEFPKHILSKPFLRSVLSPERIEDIEKAFRSDSSVTVGYIAPWTDSSLGPGSADLVLSHVVMQYFDELVSTYTVMYDWLKPGGAISHQIDFSGHQFARNEWNSHWSREEWIWRLIVGQRPGAISRLPFSAHVSAIQSAGFEILCAMPYMDNTGIPHNALARRWIGLSISDLHTRGGFIQAQKPLS
jgi:SAM-dependent methyltransferase